MAMLRNFCEPELRRRGIDLSSVWFQQDGATAHTTRASLSVLREIHYFHNTSFPVAAMFHGRHVRLISPPVITFCGVSQKQILISKPRAREELEQSIKEEIAAIPEDMTRRVMESLGVRLKQCLRKGGRHLSDVLFKS